MRKYQKVLIIVGPTSSGKSTLAVELARKFNGEVVSADSRQVYRDLNIGTGKITKREMKGVPHYLLDIASPKKTFTAHDFVQKGRAVIRNIAARNKLPIICGGTGFYIDALVGRIMLPNVPADSKLRTQLEKRSAVQLFAILKRRDPRRARTIDRHNKRRLIRALEIARYQGPSLVIPRTVLGNPYDTLWIGIALPEKQLEKKIAVRLFSRISRGMGAEAKKLHAAGLSYKRMEELGLEYRSLARLLQGKITRTQMIEELNRSIRKYAKRQLVYWKRNKNIVWFKDPKTPRISRTVRSWLKK